MAIWISSSFAKTLLLLPSLPCNEMEEPAPGGLSQELPSTGKSNGAEKERGEGEVCRNCGAPAQRFVNPVGEEFVECTQSELHTRRLRVPSAKTPLSIWLNREPEGRSSRRQVKTGSKSGR